MKKGILITVMSISLSLLAYSIASAANITTTFPQGNITAKMTKINSQGTETPTDDTWGTPSSLGTMDFGTLTELTSTTGTPLAVFAPADKSYYAIDIGFGGGGMPDPFPTVSLSYGGADELRTRINTVYKLMNFTTGEPTAEAGGSFESKYMDQAVPAFVTAPASYKTGNWVRIYLGINTNWNTSTDLNGNHVFTYASPAGSYTATITISIS